MDISRLFVPTSSKPVEQQTAQNGNGSNEESKKTESSLKVTRKFTSSTAEENRTYGERERKQRAIMESLSDSEEEEPQRRTKIPSEAKEESPRRKHPVQYETDSDSDDFLSPKNDTLKPQDIGLLSKPVKTEAEKAHPTIKEESKSPAKAPSSTQWNTAAAKRPRRAVSPKSSPPSQTRPPSTSLMDYFGLSRSCQKKLVSSSKRKAQTPLPDGRMSDYFITKQVQMEMKDLELEKEIHGDEEFARTVATLDKVWRSSHWSPCEPEAPHAKKARKDSGEKPRGTTVSSRNGSTFSGDSSACRQSKALEADSFMAKEVISPSPKKTPINAQRSQLALMKIKHEVKEEEGVHQGQMKTISPNKIKISPTKMEPGTDLSINKKYTPKTGRLAEGGTAFKVSPKKLSKSASTEDGVKKRGNISAYRDFLNREGPRALGSRDIPTGAQNCLEGCVFVLTGVLESMEREDAKALIECHGGKVTGKVSKRTTYLVLGRDAGRSKREKAESLGTEILDEDGLLKLIRTKPGKKSKYEIAAEAECLQASGSPQTPSLSKASRSPLTSSLSVTVSSQGGRGSWTVAGGGASTPGRGSGSEVRRGIGLSSSSVSRPRSSSASLTGDVAGGLLWVDKYRPRSLKALIGQQGEQSCANKLLRWLQNWHRHQGGGGGAAKFVKFRGGRDDGSTFKAALLSGPPGVGKTTTAALVCKELGYSYVETNASCTRSKSGLKEAMVAESLDNTSIKDFYTGTSQTVSKKHVLLMDEVDGMAGNEDRGGVQEMIGLVKRSRIPIIFTCNDRNHQSVRSLANHCYDLRFQRPRMEQIKAAMMSVAYKEGVKIQPPGLNEIILASNQDVRQTLHNLSMWSAKDKAMTFDQCKAAAARKDVKLGPFDVCRRVFTSLGEGETAARMSVADKIDLFFHDYSLAPLFVQENYVHVRPPAANGDPTSHLTLLSAAADSICDGDLVDRQMRSGQTWTLLPVQAVYASVLPGELMRGYMTQFPSFPSWLGRSSSTSRHSRIVQELTSHMSLKTLSSSARAVNLDYLPYLRGALLSPLQRRGAEGAGQAVRLLTDYQLVKEDVDNMMENGSWVGKPPHPFTNLDPKVKAAFTRAYNHREVRLTPYSLQAARRTKGRRGAAGGAESELGGGAETEGHAQGAEEEEEEDVAVDAMIKQKTKNKVEFRQEKRLNKK